MTCLSGGSSSAHNTGSIAVSGNIGTSGIRLPSCAGPLFDVEHADLSLGLVLFLPWLSSAVQPEWTIRHLAAMDFLPAAAAAIEALRMDSGDQFLWCWLITHIITPMEIPAESQLP